MDDYGLRIAPALPEVGNTNVTDHGGAVGGGAPVHLLFWGTEWSTRANRTIRPSCSVTGSGEPSATS